MVKTAKDLAQERKRKDREYIEGVYGEIGLLNTDNSYTVFVEGTHDVWVRKYGDPNQPVTAINQKVLPKARMPVRMRMNTSKRWEIIDAEPLRTEEFMGEAAGTANMPPLVGAAIPVVWEADQFKPGRVRALNGSDLQVFMEELPYGATLLGNVSLDPATVVGAIASGKKALIVISVNTTTNTLSATSAGDVGLPVTLTRSMALAAAIPAGDMFLKAYIISEGATTLPRVRLPADSDFQFDLRPWLTLPGGGSGTVTSVSATALPTSVFDISVTNPTTTPAIALSMDDQAANTVLAGDPASGSTAPAFRALVDADIPAALTLVGGSIENDPIGQTTPAAGYFSALRLKIGGFFAIFTHSNTADRTYTFKDANGTVAFTSDIPAAGITQLTGDVTAGPGSGSQASTLATVNSNVGSFSGPLAITANAKGLITAIATATVNLATQVAGLLGISHGGTGADLSATGAGFLKQATTGANVTVTAVDLSGADATGTLAAGRFPALTGDATTSAGSLATTLANSGVSAGSYTNTSVTFDAKGRATAASSGAAPAPVGATYIVQTADATLTNEQALSTLNTGLMKVTTTTGVVSSITDSAGLAGAISDETGSGALVFGTSPTIATPTVSGENVTDFIDFAETSTPSTPASDHARIWVADDQGFTIQKYIDSGGKIFYNGRDLWIICRNTTGSTITKGATVAVNGQSNGYPSVLLAEADNTGTNSQLFLADGFAMDTATNNNYFRMMLCGVLDNLDTSGFSAGAHLYLSTTAGVYTNSQPARGVGWIQHLGNVLTSHATTGTIQVNIKPPFLAQVFSNTVAIGVGNDATLRFYGTATFFGALTFAAITANRTWTLQDADDTIVGRATTDTLTNKTHILPTIGDFTNATHNHQNAAGGGTLTATAISDIYNLQMFGDGSDGVVTVSAPLTLTRDMYYSNLTISTGAVITPAGYRIFVSGTLDISTAPAGWISVNGGNGSGQTGGVAAVAASIAGGGTGGTGGAINANGTVGGAADEGGIGGNGGRSGSTATTGGTVTPSGFKILRWAVDMLKGVALVIGGAGGTGGTGGGVVGSGGGAGGGVIYIAANTIARGSSSQAGGIVASGGNGANPANTALANGAGAGGGGGGGWVYIVYKTLTGSSITNHITASGGTGGTGGNGGTTGGTGGTGGGGGRATKVNILAGTITETAGSAGTAGNANTGATGGTGGAGNTFQASL